MSKERFERLAKRKSWQGEKRLTIYRQDLLRDIFKRYGNDKIPFSHFTIKGTDGSSRVNFEDYPVVRAYLCGVLKEVVDGLIKPDNLILGLRDLPPKEDYWID